MIIATPILRRTHSIFAATALAAITCMAASTPGRAADNPIAATPATGRQRPVPDGPWFCLVEYTGRHLNDFTVFRARDDRWHAIGIIGLGRGKTKIEDLFFHCSGPGLHTRFDNHPELLTANPPDARLSRQKHAPHILYRGDTLHLFYRRPAQPAQRHARPAPAPRQRAD